MPSPGQRDQSRGGSITERLFFPFSEGAGEGFINFVTVAKANHLKRRLLGGGRLT